MKYIYHHLGLGDHIICNGMVRHFKEIFNEVSVFCKPQYYNNIKYMYRDDEHIHVLPIGEDLDVERYIVNNSLQNDTIKIGFDELNKYKHLNLTFDEAFYFIAKIPFDYRFSKFKFDRNYEVEENIYQKLNPNNDKYIFTHNIDKTKVRSDLKIIENPVEYCIFDILKLIENAEEVHLMESSVKCLVNSFKFDKPKFFYHKYVRNYPEYNNSKGLNNFTIIY